MFYSFYEIKNFNRKANTRQAWTYLIDAFAFPEISTKQNDVLPLFVSRYSENGLFLFFFLFHKQVIRRGITFKYLKVDSLKVGTRKTRNAKKAERPGIFKS